MFVEFEFFCYLQLYNCLQYIIQNVYCRPFGDIFLKPISFEFNVIYIIIRILTIHF